MTEHLRRGNSVKFGLQLEQKRFFKKKNFILRKQMESIRLLSSIQSLSVTQISPLPTKGPDIIGLQPRYQVGDEAQAHHVTHLPPRKTKEGLQWIELRLVFSMAGKYIRKGGLKLQCLAEVFLTYARSHHELVIGERLSGPGPQNAPNVIPSRRRPRVSGSSSRYDVGDLVDINCTSAKESTPPILRWFINDREDKISMLV
ncbi:ig-like domain-containing protein [Caerostris extrusa]|uniref:Ig-like domain-containing protein n=1 Tax=Caerostris extrusa TaxID=172846 RepID=A0AAV4QKK0_CAEEX|nr:ig-like domain-containing protein [Caerostris extrusa]